MAKVAREIKRRKLEVPAVFYLELHKPLAGFAQSAMIASSPFTAPFVGIGNVHDYSRLLGKRESVERLILALEDPAMPDDPDAEREAPAGGPAGEGATRV